MLISIGHDLHGQLLLQQERSFIHYTDAEGLPHSGITDFYQDETGFMWVATWINICRFDGYRFREYQVLNADGHPASLIWPRFFTDRTQDNLYIRTFDNRIFLYQEDQALFRELCQLPAGKVTTFQSSEKNGYWVAQDSNIWHLDTAFSNPAPLYQLVPYAASALKNRYCLGAAEKNGVIYVALEGNRLVRIRQRDETVEEFQLPVVLGEILTYMYVDDLDFVWIATEDAGVFRVDPRNGDAEHFFEEASGNYRITDDFVRAVEEDRKGNIWIGTEAGLCIWHPATGQMERHQYDNQNPEGINSNAIYPIYCDREGDVWVGTYFGGINLYSASQEFFHIIRSGEDDYSLSGHQVSCIVEDSIGNLYVGLEGDGFNRIDRQTGKVETFAHKDGTNSLSYDNVHAMLFDENQRLFIGTYTGGLNIYDPERDHFTVLNTENTPELPSDNIFCLYRHGDSIFLGTGNGLAVYESSTGKVVPLYQDVFWGKKISSIFRSGRKIWIAAQTGMFHFDMETGELQQLGKAKKPVSISFAAADEAGNIWIGDNFQGLRVYWKEQDSLSHYSPSDGFPARRVYGMIPGKGSYCWVSSSRGLLKFFPQNGNFVLYDRQSGLPFNQFNFQAYYQSPSGEIYFGGINGLIYFNEEEDFIAKNLAPVAFTDFELFNEPVDPLHSPVLSEPMHLAENIRLKYHQNVFTIRYSALNFTHPGRVQYAYYLEGFESDWNLVGNKNFVSYTNLSPGTYTLHVKASYDNSQWRNTESTLQVVVDPPFYRSNLAFVFYFLLFAAGLTVFYLVSVKIEKSKSMAALERKEKENQEKLNQLKLEFFTNISHDLRTPLTLILGPLEQLLSSSRVGEKARKKLVGINHNAQRLLHLINQLMDFRRVDSGRESLKVRRGNIISFVREVKHAFEPYAENRHIQFDYCYEDPGKEVYFDHEKLERVLFNLLSNAFKFTAEGGKVTISVRTVQEWEGLETEKEYLLLSVRDNGVGIPGNKLDQVFDRFYKTQTPKLGSGIGLAFVKSIVDLHKGSIQVESVEGEGTEFSIQLPVSVSFYSPEERLTDDTCFTSQVLDWVDGQEALAVPLETTESSPDKLDILVVDDNQELLAFLQENLLERFNVKTATNGIDALALIQKKKPDLVISDVMMPEMDGLELTQRIKESIETSHIPVILLTAKADREHHQEGFSAGADFYIEKPFYPNLLIKHVENILTTRNRLIELFKRDINLPPSEITHSKSDQDFIEKLTRVIEGNIDNQDLDVSFLLREMCVSRSLLHIKLKKIADSSATEYIRSVRLKRAAKLIVAGHQTIKETAYSTGFSSPSHFSRSFKKYFGKSPREYAKLAKSSDLLSD